MRKLESSVFSIIASAVFFAVALWASQYYFTTKTSKALNEIKETYNKIDATLMQLDTALISKQYLELQGQKLKIQQENFGIILDKQKQELFWYNISFLGIGTAFGFLALLFLIPKEIEKRAKLEVDEKIGDAIRGRSETVRHLLNTYDEESFLRQNKRIYIAGGTGKEKVRDILIENGINSENVYLDEDTAKRNKYDILFFNNLNGELLPAKPQDKNGQKHDEAKYNEEMRKHDEAFQAILKMMQAEKQSVCFFYYNETNVIFPIWEIRDYDLKKRINFVTNPAQIYGNLLNTLKYQDKISKKYN